MVEIDEEDLKKIKVIMKSHLKIVHTLVDELIEEGSSASLRQSRILLEEQLNVRDIIFKLSGGEK